jgi:hypothetical protein
VFVIVALASSCAVCALRSSSSTCSSGEMRSSVAAYSLFQLSGRARYAECPGPAPTSLRCSPVVSNQVPSKCVRIDHIVSLTDILRVGFTYSTHDVQKCTTDSNQM